MEEEKDKRIKIALSVSLDELEKHENNINPAHRADHTQRVFNLCKEILTYHKEADDEIVLIAAAFHDIGRSKKEGKHEIWSEEIAKEKIENNSILRYINEEKKRLILKIVKNHAKSDNEVDDELKNSLEFKILVDADRIDGFGPIGIIRASLDERFQKSAKEQLDHIRDKYDVDNYKLNSNGGQIVGGKYKTYLYEFERIYKEQEYI